MLVTSHRTIRDALRHALEARGLEVTSDAPPGREAVVAALGAHPHVALVDVATDAESGIETCRQLRAGAPTVVLVALTTRVASAHHAARAAGASRIVTSDSTVAELARVLATAAASAAERGTRRAGRTAAASGRTVLTEREREVLALAATGLTDAQIARTLVISHKTVKNHLHHLYAKLDARSRTDAVTLGLRRGLISL